MDYVFKVDWFYKCMWSKVNFDLMWNLKMKLSGKNFLNFVVCDLQHGVFNIYLYVEKCKYIYVSVCINYFWNDSRNNGFYQCFVPWIHN
jgi:hypothetical protein